MMADVRRQPADVIRDAVERQRAVRDGVAATTAEIRAAQSLDTTADQTSTGGRTTQP